VNEELERQERMKVVSLGIEAEHFALSSLGRHITARAEREREEALKQLIKADPHDVNAVQRLQNEVRVIDKVQQWIADAIMDGQAVEKAMVEEEVEAGRS
jgi:hypothetical protein